MINTALMKERMSELNLKEEYLADKMKMAQSTLNLKINNKRSFTIEEMFEISDYLEIKDGELQNFFNLKLA